MATQKTDALQFRLTRHRNGQFCKKIRGKLYYFGTSEAEAIERLKFELPYLRDGQRPPQRGHGKMTLREMVNRYLAARDQAVQTGELAVRTWRDYQTAGQMLVDILGGDRAADDLDVNDFGHLRAKLSFGNNLTTLGNWIGRTKAIFNWATKNQLIPPPKFGTEFDRPKANKVRKQRKEGGPKIYDAAEYREMLAAATTQMRAIILLGLNAGFGPADIGRLTLAEVEAGGEWLRTTRGKTGVSRAAWLWPETRRAINAWLAERSAWMKRRRGNVLGGCRELVFITRFGTPWHREERGSPLSHEFDKLIATAKVSKRPGINLYSLRRCLETYGGETGDQVAVDYVMGHVDPSMGATYRQGVSDDRVKNVCEAIRTWLYGTDSQAT